MRPMNPRLKNSKEVDLLSVGGICPVPCSGWSDCVFSNS